PTWLWPRWLVAGAVQLLVGRQGSGKSTFAAWVVAQLSTGRTWPDDEAPRPALRCAMLSLEEPDDRLVARLVAAGADLDSVEILGQVEDHDEDGRPYRRPWRLPGDCTALETTLVELGAAVVTIDGLGYSIRGDSHNYANVGAALSALAGVAERTGCAIVGLTHPPKGNADAVTSAIGSTAWTAVARITWVMGADPTDETGARRVVRPAPGSNYRLPDHGLGFVIGNHDETEAGFVTGLASSDVPAETITSPPLPNGGDGDDTEDACSVLADTLSGGPLWVKEARDAMTEAGFTIKQTRRAKEALKVRSVHHGKPGDAEQGWKWELPSAPRCPHNPEGAQEAQRPEVGPLGILDPGEGTLDPEEEP
ncbi:MAG: AAA family ATPase, partial [Acidimicrobiaceae bacterium]|nr:AAA family ATPase [Acidimicrobiaceae bacterium]